MLIRYEVSNFRSIGPPVELSLVAVDQDRSAAQTIVPLGVDLLTLAAIYGPNASGKSNVVASLAWLRFAIESSVRLFEDEIPVEPFAFSGSPLDPTLFTLELSIEGVRFDYLLSINREKVLYEGLFHYPEKKRRRIFERDTQELKLQRGLGGLSGTRELLTDTTLALSVARRFEEPLVTRFAREIGRMRVLGQQPFRARRMGMPMRRLMGPPMSTMRWFEDEQLALFPENSSITVESRDQALALLRLADLGIEDVLVEEVEVSYGDSDTRSKQRRVRLLHKAGERVSPLDYGAESDGTRTWFEIIGPVLTALRSGSIVVFDELDASLHPTLSAELLKLFSERKTNPRGAQLIFTTHDTSLLNHLNRDEVWLTDKDSNGITRLGALAEFAGERVRKSQNLENAYLSGRFGAIPQIDEGGLLRALGLIG
ncbi:AAA family ATPase [Mycolicibacterium austroafricanum]|uniref:AAA family ATPase n=1 Tax=Mycolicibacterium austroafricanum TaxID=39687 RepID=UPI000CF88552|nr:ATP-binding protein [Mycolicibacterium austroafricanum]PQP51125.1 RloA protein [Mycolicibacterium austroafricanum]